MIAECGTDRQRFPTAAALVSWAGFSPGQHESGGQAHPAPTRKGSQTLRTALVEAAQAAAKTDTYLAAVYRRLAARRGKQRALIAVGRHMLHAVYHILRGTDTVYHDLGPHDFDERDRQAVIRRAMRRLEMLGYRVTLEPLMPEAG
jgi:transposase